MTATYLDSEGDIEQRKALKNYLALSDCFQF